MVQSFQVVVGKACFEFQSAEVVVLNKLRSVFPTAALTARPKEESIVVLLAESVEGDVNGVMIRRADGGTPAISFARLVTSSWNDFARHVKTPLVPGALLSWAGRAHLVVPREGTDPSILVGCFVANGAVLHSTPWTSLESSAAVANESVAKPLTFDRGAQPEIPSNWASLQVDDRQYVVPQAEPFSGELGHGLLVTQGAMQIAVPSHAEITNGMSPLPRVLRTTVGRIRFASVFAEDEPRAARIAMAEDMQWSEPLQELQESPEPLVRSPAASWQLRLGARVFDIDFDDESVAEAQRPAFVDTFARAGSSLPHASEPIRVVTRLAPDGESAWEVLSTDEINTTGLGRGIGLSNRIVSACNRAIFSDLTKVPTVHAAAISWGDACMLLLGSSGAGKTTLAARLIQQGWGYLTDEAVSISGELEALPYPKPLSMKGSSAGLLGLAESALCASDGTMSLVPASEIRAGCLSSELPIAGLLTVTFDPECEQPRIEMQTDAWRLLHLLSNSLDGDRLSIEQIEILARVAEESFGGTLVHSGDPSQLLRELVTAVNGSGSPTKVELFDGGRFPALLATPTIFATFGESGLLLHRNSGAMLVLDDFDNRIFRRSLKTNTLSTGLSRLKQETLQQLLSLEMIPRAAAA